MNRILICIISISLCAGFTQAETVNEALQRFLEGKTVTPEEVQAITDMRGNAESYQNSGTLYLHYLKLSVIDPVQNGGWPLRSTLVTDDRGQLKTYRELKEIYDRNKTPIVAYALVCPAMYVNDFDLLPELIAKIGENKYLKAHFDKVYASYWKPRLDPDF